MNFPQKSEVVGVHAVSAIFVAVGIPADVNTVVDVSTVAGIRNVACLPSPVDICDVSIVSAAARQYPVF
jgi:hypothetical protein